ncbi:MAG: hypothetical protein Q7J35_05185 [Candidatus Methanoperedens sp.]|nr:hypothetical protein [Candidatus Methanoperedens sp.]
MDKTRTVYKYPEFIFIFAMMIAFFYSMVAELIGLSAIVGHELTMDLMWFLLLLTVVAILTKVIGCGIPAS